MNRRDFLKVTSAGLAYATVMTNDLFGQVIREFGKISRAKGVIFVVGDGWPLGVMKMYDEFLKRKFRERSVLFDLIENYGAAVYLQNTSSLSSVVTDSAPAGVAWATGSKTVNRMLASLPDGRPLKTILELAKEKGMSIGCVTTTRVTHATPAAWYSHNMNRDDEDNIALDILRLKLDVAMGGGQRHFDPTMRKDGRNLYQEFINAGYDVVKTRDELRRLAVSDKPILGAFNKSHLSYFVDRVNDSNLGHVQPTLAEMTMVALMKLARNPRGFVLQVEAGRIDHACHANDAYSAMMDCWEMDQTLRVIFDFMRRNPDVLLIITSDHGNSGFGINGTGPEYNDATEALMKYECTASFEYMKSKMTGKSAKEIKDIFEYYTKCPITDDEAQAIYDGLNNPRDSFENDFWYEPEATMGFILRKSKYRANVKTEKIEKPALLRRGNVGFTGTNHTAEDQLVVMYGGKGRYFRLTGMKSRLDNTDLFYVMTRYLGIKHKNPKMTEEEARRYITALTPAEWRRHLELHIA